MGNLNTIHIEKQQLREEMWHALEKNGIAHECRGRIPDFVGKEVAARNLAQLALWRNAEIVMIAPDASITPIRSLALQEGKQVYLAVPGLKTKKPFVFLDASSLALDEQTSTDHLLATGRPVSPQEMRPVDIAVGGSVAVNRRGVRLGKGRGYFDLELAMLVKAEVMLPNTPVVTSVHSMQVVEGSLPESRHDGRITAFATELGVYVVAEADHRPLTGLIQDQLGDYASEIPALEY